MYEKWSELFVLSPEYTAFAAKHVKKERKESIGKTT